MSIVGENIKLTRRSFLKLAALSSLATQLLAISETLRE
ncbi:hypothetical protein, partial [Campylobacter jejuni]